MNELICKSNNIKVKYLFHHWKLLWLAIELQKYQRVRRIFKQWRNFINSDFNPNIDFDSKKNSPDADYTSSDDASSSHSTESMLSPIPLPPTSLPPQTNSFTPNNSKTNDNDYSPSPAPNKLIPIPLANSKVNFTNILTNEEIHQENLWYLNSPSHIEPPPFPSENAIKSNITTPKSQINRKALSISSTPRDRYDPSPRSVYSPSPKSKYTPISIVTAAVSPKIITRTKAGYLPKQIIKNESISPIKQTAKRFTFFKDSFNSYNDTLSASMISHNSLINSMVRDINTKSPKSNDINQMRYKSSPHPHKPNKYLNKLTDEFYQIKPSNSRRDILKSTIQQLKFNILSKKSVRSTYEKCNIMNYYIKINIYFRKLKYILYNRMIYRYTVNNHILKKMDYKTKTISSNRNMCELYLNHLYFQRFREFVNIYKQNRQNQLAYTNNYISNKTYNALYSAFNEWMIYCIKSNQLNNKINQINLIIYQSKMKKYFQSFQENIVKLKENSHYFIEDNSDINRRAFNIFKSMIRSKLIIKKKYQMFYERKWFNQFSLNIQRRLNHKHVYNYEYYYKKKLQLTIKILYYNIMTYKRNHKVNKKFKICKSILDKLKLNRYMNTWFYYIIYKNYYIKLYRKCIRYNKRFLSKKYLNKLYEYIYSYRSSYRNGKKRRDSLTYSDDSDNEIISPNKKIISISNNKMNYIKKSYKDINKKLDKCKILNNQRLQQLYLKYWNNNYTASRFYYKKNCSFVFLKMLEYCGNRKRNESLRVCYKNAITYHNKYLLRYGLKQWIRYYIINLQHINEEY